MANMGKRMVKEPLIAQIGQGGSAEYTAGTGIDITEDVISVDNTVAMKDDIETYTAGTGIAIDANNEVTANVKAGYGIVVDTDLTDNSLVIMTDDDDIQSKLTASRGISIDSATDEISVTNDVELLPIYGVTPEEVSGIGSMTLAQMIEAGLPIFRTTYSEDPNYPYTTINIKTGDKFRVQGYFGIATDSNDNYVRVYTTANNGLQDNKSQFLINVYKNGNTQFLLSEARYRANLSGNGMTIYDIISSNAGNIAIEADSSKAAVANALIYMKLANISPNVRYDNQLAAPTTDGTYKLNATVASGEAAFAWNTDSGSSGATVYRHSITVTGFGTSQATDKLSFQLYTTSNTQITTIAAIGALLPADGSIIPATGFQTDSQTANTNLVVGIYLDQTDSVPYVKLLALDNGPTFVSVNNMMAQPSQTIVDTVDQI